MEKIKVLIADDDSDILKIMVKKIGEEGFDVVPAKDGEEAWQKIQSESPDIILLDLNMPRMHGFEVLKQLRENPPSEKWQPVIIVSGEGELGNMHKGFSLEADHYLTKPCSTTIMIKAINLMSALIPQHKTKKEIEADE
ncbi:MAG TPA: response regulator [Candidatus Omnitrophota bacterium]|nr:response regulator [Candidatus Omnitrophota bacterium]